MNRNRMEFVRGRRGNGQDRGVRDHVNREGAASLCEEFRSLFRINVEGEGD